MGMTHRPTTRPPRLSQRIDHPVISIMTLVCVIVTCIDWSTYTHMDSIDTLITCIFLALALCVPFKPVPFSCALATLSALCFLIPHALQGPSILGCAWLALAVLGCSLQYWQSIPIIVAVAACALFGDHFYSGFSGNTVIICASLLVIGASGCFMRYHQSYRQLLEQNRQAKQLRAKQEEQLRLARTLHDDVAGSMTYTLTLCRSAETMDNPQQLRTILAEIAHATSASLHGLRTNVIVPLTESNGMSRAHAEQSTTSSPTSYADLCQHILRLNHRLSTAGLDGMIRCTNNLNGGTADFVSRILTELCNNILKYGERSYLITVSATADSVIILATNTIAETDIRNTNGTNNGLRFLKSEVESRGGTLYTQVDDDEWQTHIAFPL